MAGIFWSILPLMASGIAFGRGCKTVEEHVGRTRAMAFGPCPGMGQVVGSVIRAAGFAMFDFLSTNLPGATVSELL